MSYEDFFRRVCGGGVFGPYPFQVRFQECDADFRVLEVPTGFGKTLTVVGDWLFNKPTTRLVICLPGRALTRQVVDILRSLKLDEEIQVFELMGGSEDLHEKVWPDKRAIIVGTQDVLVSRALDRGYALSPYRWPMDFGLLNNDVTWVFDEVQLLGEVVATSAQLAAFWKRFGTFGRVRCVWMTATLERDWLKTVDFREEEPVVIGVTDEDRAIDAVRRRFDAQKSISEAANCDLPRDCAAFVKNNHEDGYLTLVIANTVVRAQEIWRELRSLNVAAELLHSRFRPCDREEKVESILSAGSGVIVATQVIEAGVDLNADLMITDVAPWTSLVQRFGRVNRDGKKPHARIHWVRSPQRGKKPKLDGTQYLPYAKDEVDKAIGELENLSSAAPGGLAQRVTTPVPYRYVLRKQDLLDLFDTTPDLAGNHVDVSRFVRSGEETNVYVAWRSWDKEQDPPEQAFTSEELCPVPFFPGGGDMKSWLKKNPAWTWAYAKRGRWEKVEADRVYAGMRLLVRSEAGGYSPELGWSPESKPAVQPFKRLPDRAEPSNDSDQDSDMKRQSLGAHTDEVVTKLESLLGVLPVSLNGTQEALRRAARRHDWGKAHPVFQQTLHKQKEAPETAPEPLLAKQRRADSNRGHERTGFRHELASALALLRQERDFLQAYLVAAHHGKVRMNIRSVEGEKQPSNERRVARGVEDGDKLFAADLGGDVVMPEVELDLKVMDLGAGGWSDEAAKLLERYGPFRLAYLELLLRTADEWASKEHAK